MTPLQSEARAFVESKETNRAHAVQLAALFLTSGIDLEEAIGASPSRRRQIRMRLERLVERERLRGAARHWSYDLNRHIALTQALARLGGAKPALGREKRDRRRRKAPPGERTLWRSCS